jgi:glycosyltransferase involved in cell wall biosynthesis
MKIAIVHDWLVTKGGAENTLAQMLAVFPQADLFCLLDFIPEGDRGFLLNKTSRTSFIQKLPRAKEKYRNYLPLMPFAAERLDLSGYDVVLSSSHAAAKGVKVSAEQLHLCYCYTPFRYAWDLREQYLKEAGLDKGVKGLAARALMAWLRRWDAENSKRVHHFATLSEYVRERIKNAYGRDSEVIYPPVDTGSFTLCEQKEDFYVTVSRLVPYKKVDLIVRAFAGMPDKKLVVIGDGPDRDKVRAAAGPNTTFLGHAGAEVVAGHLRRAKAFVFAAEEDFGIAPLEAQACGTPVIAYGRGGALETIQEGVSGIFFREQTEASLAEAVNNFEKVFFSPSDCRANSLRFSEEIFRSKLKAFVERKTSGRRPASVQPR